MVATIYGRFSFFRTLLVLFSLGACDTKTLPQHENFNRYLETIILQEDFDNLQSLCSSMAGNYERGNGNGWIASDLDFDDEKGDMQNEPKEKYKNLIQQSIGRGDLMYRQSSFEGENGNRIRNLYWSQIGGGGGGNIVHRLREHDEEENSEQNWDKFKELIKELYDKKDFKMLKNLIFGGKDGDLHDRLWNSDDNNQRERLYFEGDDTSNGEKFEGAQEEEIERIVKEILGKQGNEDHTIRANDDESIWMVPLDKK